MSKHFMPNFYVPPLELPLYWRDEQTGVLPAAIWAYIEHGADKTKPEPNADQLALIIDYAQYFIKAPCWDMSEVFATELSKLREQATKLQSVADIHAWIFDCMEIGIDPF